MKLNTVVVFALLFLSSYEGVKAGLNSTPKGVVITCLGATAVFNCTYGEDDGFPHFELNDSNSIQYTDDGVKFSDVSGSYMMNLSVPGDQKFNNTYVWCVSQSNRSGPSLLIIQGSPSAPIIINVTCFNDSFLLLHLSPPSDVRDQSLLTYNLTMVLPNGTLLHQTIIPPQQSSIVMKGCTHCHPCTIHVQPLCDTAAGEKATTAFNYSDPVSATNENTEPTQDPVSATNENTEPTQVPATTIVALVTVGCVVLVIMVLCACAIGSAIYCNWKKLGLKKAIKSTLNGTQNSGDPLLNNTVHTPEDELQNVNVQNTERVKEEEMNMVITKENPPVIKSKGVARNLQRGTDDKGMDQNSEPCDLQPMMESSEPICPPDKCVHLQKNVKHGLSSSQHDVSPSQQNVSPSQDVSPSSTEPGDSHNGSSSIDDMPHNDSSTTVCTQIFRTGEPNDSCCVYMYSQTNGMDKGTELAYM